MYGLSIRKVVSVAFLFVTCSVLVQLYQIKNYYGYQVIAVQSRYANTTTDASEGGILEYKELQNGSLSAEVRVKSFSTPFSPSKSTNDGLETSYTEEYKTQCENLIHNKTQSAIFTPTTDKTSDTEVYLAALNCTQFRHEYRFVTSHTEFSDSERNFTLAYSILVHANIQQLALLLSAIYTPYNAYCIHLDAKSSNETLSAVRVLSDCFPNVFMSSERIHVYYAHVSRLQADLACFKDLLDFEPDKYQWRYMINLCGQDFPLNTNAELIEQMKALKQTNLILGCKARDELTLRRTALVYRLTNVTDESGQETIKMKSTDIKHSPPPYNMTVNKNMAYNFFTRAFINWVIYKSDKAKALLSWSADTFSPDEHYWMTLNNEPDAPGGKPGYQCWSLTRYVMWLFNVDKRLCPGYNRHGICVFNSTALYAMTKRSEVFVNKLDIRNDANVLMCLRHWLDERREGTNRHRNPIKTPQIPPWLK